MAVADMTDRDQNTALAAGILLIVNAAVHVVPGVMGMPQLFIATALYAALGAGLLAGMRWLAWPSLLIVLFVGMVAAAGGVADPAAQPQWAFVAILVLDILAALALFVHLWRR